MTQEGNNFLADTIGSVPPTMEELLQFVLSSQGVAWIDFASTFASEDALKFILLLER